MCTAGYDLLPLATFPMRHPEMQIKTPEITKIPDVKDECEYARNDATWD